MEIFFPAIWRIWDWRRENSGTLVGSAVDSEGFLYVADSDNTRIQKFDPTGKFVSSFRVSTWRGKKRGIPLPGFLARDFFTPPTPVPTRSSKYDMSGKLIAILKKKDKDGFSTATGIAVDHQNRLYVVERGPGKVARFSIPSAPAPSK